MPNYYVIKPFYWDNGEEYSCFAASAEEAIEKFREDNDFDPDIDGALIVICM